MHIYHLLGSESRKSRLTGLGTKPQDLTTNHLGVSLSCAPTRCTRFQTLSLITGFISLHLSVGLVRRQACSAFSSKALQAIFRCRGLENTS